jgi:hypothetical protein
MNTSDKPQAWIGLVDVHTDDEELLGGNTDAYAQAVAIAANEAEFKSLVKQTAEELGFEVLEIEETETLERRLEGARISPLLEDLRKTALTSGRAVFGTFHSFPEDE